MKHSSQIGPVALSLVVVFWLSGSGCGKKTQPPRTPGEGAEAPARTPDTTVTRADSSHVATAPTPAPRPEAAAETSAKAKASPAAHPPRPTRAAEEHPATKAPSKAAGAAATSAPVTAPAPAPSPVAAPAPAPAPAPTTVAPPATAAEAAGGLDAGPRAASIPVDQALASKGKKLFNQKACSTCHKMDVRLVGPPLGPVPKERSAAWIISMIQRPAEMTRSDPIAKQLLQEYKVQMVPAGSVSEEEARELLEYIKSGGK